MQIDQFRIESYQSFKDSGWLDLKAGFNLVVGQNNSGKSALASALGVLQASNPHRNSQEFRPNHLSASKISLELAFKPDELREIWISSGVQLIWPRENSTDPLPTIDQYLANTTRVSVFKDQSCTHFVQSPSHGCFEGQVAFGFVIGIANGNLVNLGQNDSSADTLSYLIDQAWARKVFYFNAQRFSIGRVGAAWAEQLTANANNLPAVLQKLRNEKPILFDRLVQHLREIFSTIRHVTVIYTVNNEFEIRVWPTNSLDDPNLSFSLNDSGTGISQAIAILTVAMTMKHSVIIIDEVSSFLHPAAAKTLLRILQSNYPDHQYIIPTHSPEVLSMGNLATVHLVEKKGFDSTAKPVDLERLVDLRQIAGQLGMSSTDVFAADRIIWVEGPTEEACFRYLLSETLALYEAVNGRLLSIPLFLAVTAPSDFTAKGPKADFVFSVYEKLSAATFRLLQSATFGFDREDLTDIAITDLTRRSGGRVKILDRRMVECFLINPSAIANTITALRNEAPVDANAVAQYLTMRGGDQRYKAAAHWAGDYRSTEWLKNVDAALLLNDIFNTLTNTEIQFRKTRDVIEILKNLLTNDRQSVQELIDYVWLLVILSMQNVE